MEKELKKIRKYLDDKYSETLIKYDSAKERFMGQRDVVYYEGQIYLLVELMCDLDEFISRYE